MAHIYRFGVARREHRLLRYNAVFFLIHFAIADGALDYDFFTRILEGKGDGPIEWNEAVQELPVCRAVDRNGLLTSKPMTFPVFERVLKRIFMVEYDYIRASMHMIRRELGKQLDSKHHNILQKLNFNTHSVDRQIYRDGKIPACAAQR